MGGLFGGRSKPAPKPEPKPEPAPAPEPTKVSRGAEEQAASLRSRRRMGGARSLLSPAREEAQTGLSNKLGGGG